jgi:hypothetical protein
MTVAWKYVLMAVFLAGGVLFLQAGVRAAAANLRRLRSWKRFPATVFSPNGPRSIRVRVGSGSQETVLEIPRTYNAGYQYESKVTVVENPENPEDRRLTGIFDLWNGTLVAALLSLALLTGAWLIWSTTWGADVVWSGGAWQTAPAVSHTIPDFEVYEPPESWKANLFYGLVLGLAMGLPPFFTGGDWTPWRTLWAVAGIGFLLWMLQSAALNSTRSVRLSSAGLEERSMFGTRRIPLEEIGGLQFQDVAQQLENLKLWQDRRRAGIRPIEVWTVKDREGWEVLRLPAEMTPRDTFRAMRERLDRRTVTGPPGTQRSR